MSPTPASNADTVTNPVDEAAVAHRANLAELRELCREAWFQHSWDTVAQPVVNVSKPGILAFDTEPIFGRPPHHAESSNLLAPIGTGRPGNAQRTSSPTPATVGWHPFRSPLLVDSPAYIPHRAAPEAPRDSLWHPKNLVQPAREHVRKYVDNLLVTGHPSHCSYCKTRRPDDAPCPYRTYGRTRTPPQDPQPSVRHSRTSSTDTSSSEDSGPSGQPSGAYGATFSQDHEPSVQSGHATCIMDDAATSSQVPSPSARPSRKYSIAEDPTDWVPTGQDYYALLAQSESSKPASVFSTPSESDWDSASNSGYDPDNEQSGFESNEESEWDSEETSASGPECDIAEPQEDSDSSSVEPDDTSLLESDDEADASAEHDGFVLL